MVAPPTKGSAVPQNNIWARHLAPTWLQVTRSSLQVNALCILSRSSNFHWISKSPFLPDTWVPLGTVSLFYINWDFLVTASVLSDWNYGPVWFPWPSLAWSRSFQQASLCSCHSPICYRLPWRFTRPSIAGGPGQEEGFTRDFPSNLKPALCLKAICVTPPLKKGKPHLEVIYLIIAHYLQLISIRAS